jgi:hypothetical protein
MQENRSTTRVVAMAGPVRVSVHDLCLRLAVLDDAPGRMLSLAARVPDPSGSRPALDLLHFDVFVPCSSGGPSASLSGFTADVAWDRMPCNGGDWWDAKEATRLDFAQPLDEQDPARSALPPAFLDPAGQAFSAAGVEAYAQIRAQVLARVRALAPPQSPEDEMLF